MIFSRLDSLGIAYIVVRYKIASVFNKNKVGGYNYQIFTDYDRQLMRFGFRRETCDFRPEQKYMYRSLHEHEVKYFLSLNHTPQLRNAHGTIWEINGTVRRLAPKEAGSSL